MNDKDPAKNKKSRVSCSSICFVQQCHMAQLTFCLVPGYQGEITTEKVQGKLLLPSLMWPTITDDSNLFGSRLPR